MLAACISQIALTQVKDTTQVPVNLDKIFTTVDKPAEFPGGVNGWIKYLQKNLNADLGIECIKPKKGKKVVTETVIVVFTIDTLGNVSDILIDNKRKVHPKLAAEAIRVIATGPKWIPAEQFGRKVKFRHRQSITWQVSEE